MALTYAPTTDLGTGVLVPLVKAMMRPLYILGASQNDWPMTLEMAQADIQDAQTRILQMRVRDRQSLLTNDTYEALVSWEASLNPLAGVIQTAINDHGLDKPISEPAVKAVLEPAIVTYAQQTWALLARLDNELMSLNGEDNDPGRLP